MSEDLFLFYKRAIYTFAQDCIKCKNHSEDYLSFDREPCKGCVEDILNEKRCVLKGFEKNNNVIQ